MKALYLKTGEKAMVVDVSNTLREYQMLVDGPIETLTLWWDDLVIICNEEGRYNWVPNRALRDSDLPWEMLNDHYDIHGDFLIVGWDKDDQFTDIPEEMVLKYTELMNEKHHMWNFNEDGEWCLEMLPERAN